MTWKTGDTVSLPVALVDTYGRAVSYASLAAFNAAGWSIKFLQAGAVMASPPTCTVLPDPTTSTTDGVHYITFALPAGGSTTLRVIPPSTYTNAWDYVLAVPNADTDSINGTLAASVGIPVNSGNITSTVTAITMVEGDSLQYQFAAVPLSALKVYDNGGKIIYSYADLSDIGGQPWTIAVQARYQDQSGQLPTNAVAFTINAAITDKVNRICAMGWLTPPAAAIVDSYGAAATAVLSTNTVGSVAVTAGGYYYSSAPVVSFSGGGGSGAAATATVVAGAVTAVTVTNAGTGYATPPTVAFSTVGDPAVLQRTFKYDVQLQPPVASTYAGAKLTVFSGQLTITRQQTTTP